MAALDEAHRRLTALKRSKEAVAGETITSLAGHEPLTLVSLMIGWSPGCRSATS